MLNNSVDNSLTYIHSNEAVLVFFFRKSLSIFLITATFSWQFIFYQPTGFLSSFKSPYNPLKIRIECRRNISHIWLLVLVQSASYDQLYTNHRALPQFPFSVKPARIHVLLSILCVMGVHFFYRVHYFFTSPCDCYAANEFPILGIK